MSKVTFDLGEDLEELVPDVVLKLSEIQQKRWKVLHEEYKRLCLEQRAINIEYNKMQARMNDYTTRVQEFWKRSK